MNHMFLPGNKVNYVGTKFASEIGTKVGEVVCKVGGEPNGLVVDFGDDAYVVNANSLRLLPSDREVVVNRRRREDDE